MQSAHVRARQHGVGRELAQAHPQPDLVGRKAPVLGEAGDVGRHDEQAGSGAGDGELVGAHGGTGQVPDGRPELHRRQHRAHRRHPARQQVGPCPASGRGRWRDRSRSTTRARVRPRRSRACPWPGRRRAEASGRVRRARFPGQWGGSAMASRRKRQSWTVCQAHAPGATAAISRDAPVAVMGRPVSSATWSSAIRASSSNFIRSAGSTLLSGSPPLATPWARVRARSTRAPPGDEPPMSWSRSPRICSRKFPPAPGPGNATPRIVGGLRRHPFAGSDAIKESWRRSARSPGDSVGGQASAQCTTFITALAGPRSMASSTVVPGGTVYRRSWRSATELTPWVPTATTTSPGLMPASDARASRHDGRHLGTLVGLTDARR